MSDSLAVQLRRRCGHDSRDVIGCLDCEAAARIEGLQAEVRRLTAERDALKGRERHFLDLFRNAHASIAEIEAGDEDEEELLNGVRLFLAKAIQELSAAQPGGEPK